MDVKKILMPDGRMRTFYCGDDQTWADIIQNVVLPTWQDYCNEHWIDHSNHESMWSFEKRTKSFLDRIAWLYIQSDPGELVESTYKAVTHKVKEIPVTECPSEVTDYLYSQRIQPSDDIDEHSRFEILLDHIDEEDKRPKSKSKRKKKETRFTRIAKVCKKYPDAKRTWCSVDANNDFTYQGVVHHIPEGVCGYDVFDGKHDAMDRILVVDDGGTLRYYDQNVLHVDFSF